MKIIVIGAGIGGLQAAKVLAGGGHDVTVYEKNKREALCYDWTDDISQSVFSDLNIEVPEGSYHGDDVALVAPFSKKPLKVHSPEETRDWVVERRVFSQQLSNSAVSAGAKVNFDTPVEKLLFVCGKVAGVYVNCEAIKADLVIDSSGVYSLFRESLPDSYNIDKKPGKGLVFRVYRAFFAPQENVPYPTEYPKKVYLKHLGEMGISWCMVEPKGYVNVLVGRTDELPQSTLENALKELRKDNPIIGTKILRGGTVSNIPIRYPLSRMVGPGYAAIGDAAFMTIPMIGSGIVHSLRAGQMLGEAILKDDSVSVETLWKYQVRYYTQIGAGDLCVDKIKRMLLSTDANDIRYLFDNGVINEKDMGSISSGEAVTMTPAQIIDKVKKGWKKLDVLLALKSAIGKGEKAEQFAKMIPREFDENKVRAWQQKLDAMFN